MIKRILALLIIPLLLFCSCSNNSNKARLTVEEYGEAMDKAWIKYRDEGYGVFIKISLEVGSDFSQMRERKTEILAACEKMDAALDEFAEINPPEDYQELHDKLVKSIKDEKRWNEYRKKGFSAETEEKADEYFDKISEELDALESGETFPSIYLEIYFKLNES